MKKKRKKRKKKRNERKRKKRMSSFVSGTKFLIFGWKIDHIFLISFFLFLFLSLSFSLSLFLFHSFFRSKEKRLGRFPCVQSVTINISFIVCSLILLLLSCVVVIVLCVCRRVFKVDYATNKKETYFTDSTTGSRSISIEESKSLLFCSLFFLTDSR